MPRRRTDAGYSMPGLLAGIAIMLILMTVAVPSWQYVMKDAREEELIFRGCQIAEAIERFQKKNGNAPPVSLEVLVQGRYLRKAYTDPMTPKGKWRFVRPGEPVGPVPGPKPGGPLPSPSPSPGAFGGPGTPLGPILGVASTNPDKSLRMFNGRTKYSDWLFVAGQPRVVGRPPGPAMPPGGGAFGPPRSSPSPGGQK
ncbi:MAG TPA: type II secretion system protein [Vicinamibacteria bacterium]|nr:type II secretion system protein [Vicinamibacteria bacterium]